MKSLSATAATLALYTLLGCASNPVAWSDPSPDADVGDREAGTVVPFDAAYEDVEVDADLPLPDGGGDGGTEAGPAGCAAVADGTPCKAAPDLCHSDGVCKLGKCMAPAFRTDGYNWKPADVNARCCGGVPVYATDDTNCGACGIGCNAGNGESCQALAGHYFCRGCKLNSGCWSKCCSNSFSPPSCAASDCKGNCDSTYCPPGSKCMLGNGMSSNYCAY